MYFRTRTGTAGIFLAIVMVVSASFSPGVFGSPSTDLRIHEVVIDYDAWTLTIIGQGFDVPQDTTVTLGGPYVLPINSENSTAIEVQLPADFPDGNYLLEVRTNGGNSGQDEFDLAIRRPQEKVIFSDVPNLELIIPDGQTFTLASFIMPRNGIATIMMTFEISGEGGHVRAVTSLYKNNVEIPSGNRGFDTDDVNGYLTANLHLTTPVSQNDNIRIDVLAEITDSGNVVRLESPAITILINEM